MDKEALITAVFEKPPIWDKREKLHSNRNVIDKYWKEISTQMKENELKVRKQWKYLRDQFSVELGKYPPPRSGDSAEGMPASKWPYFSQLLFLKDTVKPRAATGNLSSTKFTRDTQMTDQEDSQSVEGNENSENEDASQASEHELEKAIETTPTSSKTTSILTPLTTKKRRGTPDTFRALILEIERRKVDYLESKTKRSSSDDQDDEHLSFFKSLLPHVRKIPDNRILSFCCRVQELVDQFSYDRNTCPRPFSSASSHSSSALSSGYQNAYTSVPLGQQSPKDQSHLAFVPRPFNSNQQQNTPDNNTTSFAFLLPNDSIHPWN